MEARDMDWQMVDECNGVRLMQADGCWSACPAGLDPWHADSTLSQNEALSRSWYADMIDEAA